MCYPDWTKRKWTRKVQIWIHRIGYYPNWKCDFRNTDDKSVRKHFNIDCYYNSKESFKPVISRNKVGERVKALLQTNISYSLNNSHGCISNKKKDYYFDNSQTKFPGKQKQGKSEFTSKNLWKEKHKRIILTKKFQSYEWLLF